MKRKGFNRNEYIRVDRRQNSTKEKMLSYIISLPILRTNETEHRGK